MIQPDSPFVLIQALATMGRSSLLERLAKLGHSDVGMPDIKLLWCLGDDPLNVQQAAEMMGTTKQFAARTVTKLRDAGLLEVKTFPSDRRASAITATPKGADLIAIVAKERDAIEQEWLSRLGSEKLAGVTGGLAALLA